MGRALVGRDGVKEGAISSEWTSVAALDDLRDGKATRVTLEGSPVFLLSVGERVFAMGNRCTHQGAPLDRGRVKVGGSLATVTCPAHGSVFGLEDGRVLRGPATNAVESYETRVVDGKVEVRRRS